VALYAQLEGSDRGVAPIDSSTTYEVSGISVDVVGNSADAARDTAWRIAQERGWKALWASTHHLPATEAPDLPDSTLNGIVAGIVVDNEQIGPTRYMATLGVLFDKAKTGPLLGIVEGVARRSVPMLVIPVMQTGSTFVSFEWRNEWQKAWARFRTGNSAIDYVRPVGNGIDPLLLNAAQTGRPGRSWWRMLLGQYGASDIVAPEVQLKRLYPEGPVIGVFTARHGPDGAIIARFGLKVGRSDLIPKLPDEGVRQIDLAYSQALADGRLNPDSSLNEPEPVPQAGVAEQIEQATSELANQPADTGPIPVGTAATFNIQVETPTAASVNEAELSVSRVRGVTSAITTSLALGGTSVMHVTYVGNIQALQAALQAEGWTAQMSGSTLRPSRAAGPVLPNPPPPPSAPAGK